ncbi:MAG: NAD-dependent epimerase/dehydratase family protein [Pirellulaceae bacterium]|nr:NAD-dependent epimerase/dehydratase family protein [Pirellulaceae bacterium]
MTILVTGGTGLLGNNLVRLLLERGERVRVLVRDGADPRPMEGLDVELVAGDVRDESAVRRACQGASSVIHAAADVRIGWTRIDQQRAVNVEGTRQVGEAARAAGLRLVYVSTVDTLGLATADRWADEQTPPGGKVPCGYVCTKQEAERVLLDCVARGLDGVVVHPGFMLGPWDWKPSSGRMFLEVARRFTPVAPSGGCSVCDVRDVAAGVLSALAQGRCGRSYILGGANISYFELWTRIAGVAGSRPPRLRAGPVMRWVAGTFGDAWTRISGRESDVNSAAVASSSQLHYYSSARAADELDYRNRPLDETLQEAWQWFQAHGYA